MRIPGLPFMILSLVVLLPVGAPGQPPGVSVKGDVNSKAAQSRTVRGRVVDLSGNSIAGVSLHVPDLQQNRIAQGDNESPHAAQTKTDADGRFVLNVEPDRRLPLIAAHPGFTVELFDIPQQGEVTNAEIVLRPEQLIHGRMIDSEGRAVPGARILIGRRLSNQPVNLLDEYLEERKKPPVGEPVENKLLRIGLMPDSYFETSDAEGRFVIRGIAADGACEVFIFADRFVRGRLVVANRPGLDPDPYNQRAGGINQVARSRLVGPDFTHVGIPGLTIEGRATVDGEPAMKVIVRASANRMIAGMTTTGANGHYRLEGLPRGSELSLSFNRAQGQTDLVPHQVKVAAKPDDVLKTVDVDLKRGSANGGTLLSGRIIDPLTGMGVPAFIRFVPLAANEFANQPRFKEMGRGGRNVRATAAGEFQIPVIPGPGAVIAQVNGTIQISERWFSPFRHGFMSDADREKLKIVNGSLLVATGGRVPLDLSHAVKYVDLAEGVPADAIEMTLDRGQTIELEIVDAEGQPVTGASISGIDESRQATRLGESRTTIYAINSESPRTVVVLHAQRGLAGAMSLVGTESSPVRMKLGKTAAIRGRAVDKSGEPLAVAEFEILSEATSELHRLESAGRPQTTTDKEGRFHIENVIPGQPFKLRIRQEGKFLNAVLTIVQQELKPGKNVDFGDIVFASLK